LPKALTSGTSGTATIQFDNNEFLGLAAGLDPLVPAGHAEYGIVWWNRPVDCTIGPRFVARNYRTAFMSHPFTAAVAPFGPYGPQNDRNLFAANMSDPTIPNPGGGTTPLIASGDTAQREWRRPFVYRTGITTASSNGSQWLIRINNSGNYTVPALDVTP